MCDRSELVAMVCFIIVCDRSELVARVCFTIVCDRSELVVRVCFTIVCALILFFKFKRLVLKTYIINTGTCISSLVYFDKKCKLEQ